MSVAIYNCGQEVAGHRVDLHTDTVGLEAKSIFLCIK